jgi:hypothetical protein
MTDAAAETAATAESARPGEIEKEVISNAAS